MINSYLLNVDNEEKNRLYKQNKMLKILFGDNFCVPIIDKLEEGIDVLDSGCGPGYWSLEMAKKYPRSNFYGIDKYYSFENKKNCFFKNHDLIDKIDIENKKFYYIRQRLLSPALQYDQWEKVINNLKHICKINGWIEFMEMEICAYDMGPIYKKLNNIAFKNMEKLGFRPNIAKDLKNILINHKFREDKIKDINKHTFIYNRENREISDLFRKDLEGLFNNLEPSIDKEVYNIVNNIDNIYNEDKENFKKLTEFKKLIEEYEKSIEYKNNNKYTNCINIIFEECKIYQTYYKWHCIYVQNME